MLYSVKSLFCVIAVVESLHPLGSCRELAARGQWHGLGGGGRADWEHCCGVCSTSGSGIMKSPTL